jgi:4-hydroxybenzoate polyprenyltransferase
VDRWAPERLKPWLQLGRFDRPAGIWLLMLPGWQGVALASAQGGRWPSPWLLLLFLIGAAVMRAAGCAYNDAVDRDLDRKVTRTAGRPVASGRISRRAAVVYAVGLSLVGLAVLLQMNMAAVLAGTASVVLVAAYPFMKRITWWPQAWLGLTFNWGALVGWLAAGLGGPSVFQMLAGLEPAGGGRLDAIFSRDGVTTLWPMLLLYASGVFWTLGYDTIYALQDLEDDALAGVKSSARWLGDGAVRAVKGFYVVSGLLALAAMGAAGLGGGWMFWAPFALHLMWQGSALRLGDTALALRLFKSNVRAGLLLFGALALCALQL